MKTLMILLMLVAIEAKGQMNFVGNAYDYYTKNVYAVYLDTLSISCYQDVIYHSPTFYIQGKIIDKKGEVISQTFCYEFDYKVPYHTIKGNFIFDYDVRGSGVMIIDKKLDTISDCFLSYLDRWLERQKKAEAEATTGKKNTKSK